MTGGDKRILSKVEKSTFMISSYTLEFSDWWNFSMRCYTNVFSNVLINGM